MADPSGATPTITVKSQPVSITAPVRKVAETIDQLASQEGSTVTWNAARTKGSVSESSPQGNLTLNFKIGSNGSGESTLTVEMTFESPLLDLMPAELIEAQLSQASNQLAAVVSGLATRELGGAPGAGLE